MTLPLYLVDAAALGRAVRGTTLRLDGPEGRHAATVRRTSAGERLLVGDGAGRLATCAVLAVVSGALDLRVEEVADVPAADPSFVLVQALAKGDRDEQAIEAATELGVDEVVPWQASRSIVQWRGDRGAKSWHKWDGVLVAATKQSRRAWRPRLAPMATTADLAGRVAGAAAAYVLHEEATDALATTMLPASGDVVLVVGPEGGIAPEELTMLTGAGARAVRLGRHVLRSSSAGPAALAVLSAAARWR
jgi:16S rRNA (uracil1498-N3)-methyltransferase